PGRGFRPGPGSGPALSESRGILSGPACRPDKPAGPGIIRSDAESGFQMGMTPAREHYPPAQRSPGTDHPAQRSVEAGNVLKVRVPVEAAPLPVAENPSIAGFAVPVDILSISGLDPVFRSLHLVFNRFRLIRCRGLTGS